MLSNTDGVWNLEKKKALDLVAGGIGIALLRPWVRLAGLLLRRDHQLRVGASLTFIKMLGGGSLIIALPSLLGLRRQYPNSRFVLVCSPSVRPFAETLGIFDDFKVIDDSSLFKILVTGLKALFGTLRSDTLVDLEVYSRLTTVFSALTCSRNRIGFYLESTYWRSHIHTHLLFFNRYAGSFEFYDQIARLLEASPAPPSDVKDHLIRTNGLQNDSRSGLPFQITLGHSCSEMGRERMLSNENWTEILKAKERELQKTVQITLLGGKSDRERGATLAEALSSARMKVTDLTGRISLPESIQRVLSSDLYLGIDSALLHYARAMGVPNESWWGPTDPETRLRSDSRSGNEKIHYEKITCSPCIHNSETPPCRGENHCIQNLFKPEGERIKSPLFMVNSASR